MNAKLGRMALVCAGLLVLPVAAWSQVIMGSNRPPKPPAPERIMPKPQPRQRLDAGALLCPSEAELEQHQRAVSARLDGQDAAEPVGCRPVRTMTPVTVIERHGAARTSVRLPTDQIGWTDAAVRDLN